MTTEVFRNMLYAAGSEARLRDVRFVVLDECHYINDAGRGHRLGGVGHLQPARDPDGGALRHDRQRGAAGRLVPPRPRPDRPDRQRAPARAAPLPLLRARAALAAPEEAGRQPRAAAPPAGAGAASSRPWEVQVDPDEVVAAAGGAGDAARDLLRLQPPRLRGRRCSAARTSPC